MKTLARIIGNHVRLFRDGGATADIVATASRARDGAGVATIVTAVPHGFATGDKVTIAGLGGVGYNLANKTITVVDDTSFTYASPGDLEATTADVGGTVTRAGVAGRTVRPRPTDASWIDPGIISELGFDRTGTADQVFAPNPGKIELYDVIETKVVNGIKFTADQMSPVAIEVLMATDALDESSTDYVPNFKVTKKFWVEITQYDQDDNLVNTAYLYCFVKINGEAKFGDKHVTFAFECQKLASTLNKGTLTTA